MTLKLSQLSNLELYHYLQKNNLSEEEMELIELELENRGLVLDGTDYTEIQKEKITEDSDSLETKYKLYIILAPFICLIFVSFYRGAITSRKNKQFWNYFILGFVFMVHDYYAVN